MLWKSPKCTSGNVDSTILFISKRKRYISLQEVKKKKKGSQMNPLRFVVDIYLDVGIEKRTGEQ